MKFFEKYGCVKLVMTLNLFQDMILSLIKDFSYIAI